MSVYHVTMEAVCVSSAVTPAPLSLCCSSQAQRQQELLGVGERGGPSACHLHGEGRQHEGGLQALLRRPAVGETHSGIHNLINKNREKFESESVFVRRRRNTQLLSISHIYPIASLVVSSVSGSLTPTTVLLLIIITFLLHLLSPIPPPTPHPSIRLRRSSRSTSVALCGTRTWATC